MKSPIDVDEESAGHAVEEGGIRIAIRASSMSYAYLNVYSLFANFMRFVMKEALICSFKDQ